VAESVTVPGPHKLGGEALAVVGLDGREFTVTVTVVSPLSHPSVAL